MQVRQSRVRSKMKKYNEWEKVRRISMAETHLKRLEKTIASSSFQKTEPSRGENKSRKRKFRIRGDEN